MNKKRLFHSLAGHVPPHVLGFSAISWISAGNMLRRAKLRCWRVPKLLAPIFIIGSPRSGTTIAMKLIETHPWVANLSEVAYVWDPYHFFDPAADHCWTDEMIRPNDVQRLHTTFELYRKAKKKKRFLNKHPRNSVRLDYLSKVFPDAFYIHVMRDGRAVTNSILETICRNPERRKIPYGNFCKPPGWRQMQNGDPVAQAAIQWREITRYILENKKVLGNRYLAVRYEDLCEKPREVLASAFSFVGLPFSDEYLSAIPNKLDNRNDKFKKNFSTQQIKTIYDIQKDLLLEIGYAV